MDFTLIGFCSYQYIHIEKFRENQIKEKHKMYVKKFIAKHTRSLPIVDRVKLLSNFFEGVPL